MSDATPITPGTGTGAPGGNASGAPGDVGIVARVSAAAHEPFAEVWRRYETDVWLPVRRVLEEAAAAHERALAASAGAGDAGGGDGARKTLMGRGDRDAGVGPGERDASGALARYRDVVSEDVIEPLRVVLAGCAAATTLEESLASAADRARSSVAELPAIARVPSSRAPVTRVSGVGPVRAIKRGVARVLGPVVWRGRTRRVAVARLARQHLDQVVLRAQASAFRRSQHDRAEWLGRLERAWADWAAAVLRPIPPAGESQPPADPAGEERRSDETRIADAAGAALQAELRALIDEIDRPSGRARSVDFPRLEELLAASVAVAGTFAADPPSSRSGAGSLRERAVQWDAWAEGAAARLELYRSLVAMRRDVDGIVGALRADWSRTVQDADAVLAEVAAELSRGRARAENLSVAEEALASMLETERRRTDDALADIQGRVPKPDAVFEALTASVEEVVHGLDRIRERMPGTLALHGIPDPGDAPRRPPPDGRAVRLRETFLHAFDTLRRERMRAAPSAIREATHRVRSEVAELREVCGYGYAAAVAEMEDDHASGSVSPTALVADGLVTAGRKADAARDRLRAALATAVDRVATEIAAGSRQLIEQAMAARVTAGYLEARTYLTARLIRMWKRWRGRLRRTGARVGAASAWLAALLRRIAARLGLGPTTTVVADLREHSLAYAEEYPGTLPVVYRRLFALEPLTDPRMLAGRDDALAAVWAAWSRREPRDARAIVVVASPGAGVTSFLNIVADRLSQEAPGGVRRTFGRRVREEEHLAASLADWLDLPGARDLDALADRILEAPREAVPGFAILEATEHLHLRAPGGGRLFERLLTFMSRTESRVFWVLAIASSAWQLVAKRASAFVHDIERVELDDLSPDQLRRAILARHRLSGLPLLFAEPRDGRAALRRRARRLRGTDKQTELVEADYFQRLHRASRGSIRLALFHWMRSADFATIAGSLLVQPLEALNSGIGDLERAQDFALKAILDHGTLTVAEYCDVARVLDAEGAHILRSLEERRLIEAVAGSAAEGSGGDGGRGEGERGGGRRESGRGTGSRYRIRPLMIGAVAAHLRSRNILH